MRCYDTKEALSLPSTFEPAAKRNGMSVETLGQQMAGLTTSDPAQSSSKENRFVAVHLMTEDHKLQLPRERYRINNTLPASWRVLPADASPMLALYRDLYERTDGLFTPLVGGMLSDAGYDAQYSLRQKKELEAAPSWDGTFEWNGSELDMKKPALLDFGAAGKGYLFDLVAEVLEETEIFEYCIDAGGDILQKGRSAIRVGLEDPENFGKAVGVCELHNGSICGSAGNRRAWGEFTHIIDPKKLSSPKGILAVWVAAKTAMVADALATCLFFVQAESLAGFYDFEYVIVRSDRTLERSPNFPGEAFVS